MRSRLEIIEAMLAKGSRDPFVWYARAMELRGAGRTHEALSAYADVAREFPQYVPTYLMAAQLAAETGQKDEAKRWAERGVDVSRQAGDAHTQSEIESLLATLR